MKVTIHFYAANGTEIGFGRKRNFRSQEALDSEVARLTRGINLRTRRQTAGTDSRKVARVEIVEGWS